MLLNIDMHCEIDTKVIKNLFSFLSSRRSLSGMHRAKNGNRCFYYNLMRELFQITRAISMLQHCFSHSPRLLKCLPVRLEIMIMRESVENQKLFPRGMKRIKIAFESRFKPEFEYVISA